MSTSGRYVCFDGMTWPNPATDVGYTLRYGTPTREDLLFVASIADAYETLIRSTHQKRTAVVRRLRDVEDAAGPPLGGSPAGARGEGENSHGQYVGTDWREALTRNVTVSLEFAEHDLGRCEDCGDALVLVCEALAECRRLLALPAPTTDATEGRALRSAARNVLDVASPSSHRDFALVSNISLDGLRAALPSTPGAPTP